MILDDIHDTASLSELVNGALTCKYHKWSVNNMKTFTWIAPKSKSTSLCCFSPYIIGTSNQPVKMTANHGLHLSFRYSIHGVPHAVQTNQYLPMQTRCSKQMVSTYSIWSYTSGSQTKFWFCGPLGPSFVLPPPSRVLSSDKLILVFNNKKYYVLGLNMLNLMNS